MINKPVTVERGFRELGSLRTVTRKHSNGSYSRTFFLIRSDDKYDTLANESSLELPTWDTLTDLRPVEKESTDSRMKHLERRVATLETCETQMERRLTLLTERVSLTERLFIGDAK